MRTVLSGEFRGQGGRYPPLRLHHEISVPWGRVVRRQANIAAQVIAEFTSPRPTQPRQQVRKQHACDAAGTIFGHEIIDQILEPRCPGMNITVHHCCMTGRCRSPF